MPRVTVPALLLDGTPTCKKVKVDAPVLVICTAVPTGELRMVSVTPEIATHTPVIIPAGNGAVVVMVAILLARTAVEIVDVEPETMVTCGETSAASIPQYSPIGRMPTP